MTSSTSNRVSGDQTLGTTLTLADATNFDTTGKFTVDGFDGTCSYSGKSGNQLTGITGCSGKVKDGAAVTFVAFAPGVYKWNGTTWGSSLTTRDATSHAHDLPDEPERRRLLHPRPAHDHGRGGVGRDERRQQAEPGRRARAEHRLEPHRRAGRRRCERHRDRRRRHDQSPEQRSDKATADSDAKSGKVGIGASVSINLLDANEVKASVENGATFTGGGKLEITADQRHIVETEDKAGTEGGIAISPSVAIAIVRDHTTAHLGSGNALTVTSGVTIQATEELESSLKSDAAAAGKDVAIGAAVGINIVDVTTTGDIGRNLTTTGGGITVGASTTSTNDVETMASAKGESDSGDSADDQKQTQTHENPNTNGKAEGQPTGNSETSSANSDASSKSGDSGGGVGIAAGISFNWITGSNTAEVLGGVQLSATGAVKVSGQYTVGATAKAIANAFDTSLTASDARIGAAIGFNYVDVHNHGYVDQDAQIDGNGITVEAVSPADHQFIVWGVSAGGGKTDAGVAASIGIQVISIDAKARVDQGAHLTSGDAITVQATDTIGLQTIAVGGALAISGTGVGGAIAVNILPAVQTQALVESGTLTHVTQLDALNGISVTATTTFKTVKPDVPKVDLPEVSSVAGGGAAASGDPAVSGSVIVDVFSFTTSAHIAAGSQVNQHPKLGWTPGATQTIDVHAKDDTHVVDLAGSLSLSTSSAAVGVGLIVHIIDKSTTAYLAGNVTAHGKVTVKAESTETYFMVAADVAVSASGAAFDGSVIVLAFNAAGGTGTQAYIDSATTLNGFGDVEVTASDAFTTQDPTHSAEHGIIAGNAQFGGSSGIGIAVAVIDRQGTVDAAVKGGDITSRGSTGLTVTATQSVELLLVVVAGSGGESAGVAGSVAVDILDDTTHAHIDGGTRVNCAVADSCANGGSPSATQGIAVAASDTTKVLSIVGALAIGGSAGVGAGVDVEDIQKDTAGVDRQRRPCQGQGQRHRRRDVERDDHVDLGRRLLRRQRRGHRQRRRLLHRRHDQRLLLRRARSARTPSSSRTAPSASPPTRR